ncbi:DUF3240 family protein [Aestuariibacter halophilus]|uniref:DUF3240 family protein n=1 Tax=Fluctibacter halophilus TaxID=226011 RepID=A0ABS8GCI7_9ALTE|nr:DUF3240 family protein [Aestuariibacter halophilus]MCC2617535.1 DUF3240 family protein [Aestuariibacter halophilus]
MDKPALLVLTVPLDMKDDIVDVLLADQTLSGFTLRDVEGHSREHQHYDLIEQVQGHQHMVQVDILVDIDELPPLMERLRGIQKAQSLRYWVLPVLEQGRL